MSPNSNMDKIEFANAKSLQNLIQPRYPTAFVSEFSRSLAAPRRRAEAFAPGPRGGDSASYASLFENANARFSWWRFSLP